MRLRLPAAAAAAATATVGGGRRRACACTRCCIKRLGGERQVAVWQGGGCAQEVQ